MISKNKSRFIVSLQRKKTRDEEGLYVIEGDKIVREFLTAGISLHSLFAKPEFINSLGPELIDRTGEINEISYEELKQISSMKSPNNALALVPVSVKEMNSPIILETLCAALDFVQDPGNLGTIIRAAAWFGIKNIICSETSVDIYNPKVIQSTMGAILHVNVYYCDLAEFLSDVSAKKIPVFGTVLEGTSMYTHQLDNKGVILLGNESRGISPELRRYITEEIRIPGVFSEMPGIDSLNVGMAASVVFSEFFRREVTFGRQ